MPDTLNSFKIFADKSSGPAGIVRICLVMEYRNIVFCSFRFGREHGSDDIGSTILATVSLKKLLKELETKIKKTDGTSIEEKSKCWNVITKRYNEQNETGVRTSKQLKELYAILKRRARKNLYNDKVEQMKTGGGQYTPQSDARDMKLVAALKDQFVPDYNPFDSSAKLFEQAL
ncbi:myb/sant-like dna-binding domain [Holotrichia oblita]|uniref:Myb/sant-like dna-binding domain n=1 Tax=Holotrichia oblita TaxID=644536 RepID=A0ACB9TUE7_HOLOL|nr:myb/sant-like dna-binding domain [Holotrichia oblita]